MTSSLAEIAKSIAVSVKRETVLIELICTDAYGAQVLCEDIQSRLTSGRGLSLAVDAEPVKQDGDAS
ncbi:hypothetical protein JQ633_12440 [Bradyrhizobium tropiciagri]|uniref:hypothetical protein n=1 Tax=Bradyrhizobium tropiciagri TaxID=312253 RepID=UPI001BA6E8EF|nr:hypothetical protein [Bradyrhizobium tropiciagri]MBR0871171.1 hypothetical protein [Bradyrhizobium tropiciagri]